MNIDDIKQISLVDFLHHLGYEPTGRDSKGLWFYAPYRNERKPSFHVNPRKGLWYDFGTGEGATFSLSPENCQADPNLLSRQDISPKQ